MVLTSLGSYTRSCLRVSVAFIVVLVLTVFYFANDFSNPQHDFLWKSSGYDEVLTFQGSFESNNSNESSSNLTVKEGYLVWNPHCRIPDIDPLHESIRDLVKKVDRFTCSNMIPLTSVSNGKLLYNQKVAPQYSQNQRMKCCYKTIWRPIEANPGREKPDDFYVLSPCYEFKSDVNLNSLIEYIMVECNVQQGWSGEKSVYKNMHAIAVKKTPSQRLIDKVSAEKEEKPPKMNVLILGIDGVSRMNFLRTMPQTASVLEDQGWVEMKGYNKVGLNTFPNLIAMLTGKTESQLTESCWPSGSSKFDDCPFVWKNYSNQGYLTAYAEDESKISTFNFLKNGFTNIPTDYYLRPFIHAAYEHLEIKYRRGLRACLGPVSVSEHILKYTMDLMTDLQDTLYFALIWLNNFSHDDVNTPSSMDWRYEKLVKEMWEKGILNTTAIFFISDHGCRYGKIRETFVGWFEERLPFLHVWVPLWFREQYPDKFKNLVVNANRLTTPFDVYMTLHEIANDTHANNVTSSGCPKCVSLFSQVPWNRSCEEAGITEHWCTCSQFQTLLTESPFVRSMVDFVVQEINSLLLNSKNSTTTGMKCAKLKAKRTLSVRSITSDKTVKQDHFVVMFETLPGEAIFEATVSYGQKFQLVDTISRNSYYGNQSSCINDAFFKQYCFCETESWSVVFYSFIVIAFLTASLLFFKCKNNVYRYQIIKPI